MEKGFWLVAGPGGLKLPKPQEPDKEHVGLSMAEKTEISETLPGLAGFLSTALMQPVLDQTKVTGRYSMVLDVSFSGLVGLRGGDRASLPELTESLHRLGLKLEPKSIEVHHLIVEKADKKPVEN